MIFLLDNYDSFTYNIFQYISDITNEKVLVKRNDKISIKELKELNISRIFISPGPGRPENAGITKEVIEHFKKSVPILGICLGHQAICRYFGEKIVYSKKLHHGKTSIVEILKNDPIFFNLNKKFVAGRYHSLSVKRKKSFKELDILAVSSDDEIMAVKHKKFDIYGLQFHPESILTEKGKIIIRNFMEVGKNV